MVSKLVEHGKSSRSDFQIRRIKKSKNRGLGYNFFRTIKDHFFDNFGSKFAMFNIGSTIIFLDLGFVRKGEIWGYCD